jgi:hypothetical protein
MEIIRVGSQPSAKGPEDWFTGCLKFLIICLIIITKAGQR